MSDDLVIDIDTDVSSLPDGLYLCEVKEVSYRMTKNDTPAIVINCEISEGPYKGARVSDWISRDPDQEYNFKQLNAKRLKGFIAAVVGDTDFDGKLHFVKNADDNLVSPEFEGLELGVYIVTKGEYTNVGRGGYVSADKVNSTDESPFA